MGGGETMSDVNHVILIGRLTRDAELKYTQGGMPICRFAIAVNRKKKAGDGWVEEASFFDVVLWGKAGEALAQYLVKGKQIAISGELHQNRWEQDGQARSKVEIQAENVQLLGGGNDRDGVRGGPPSPAPARGRSDASQGQGTAPAGRQAPDDFNDDIPF
jgi:single-strand DNA-binding protein